jgi:hypothetical protein
VVELGQPWRNRRAGLSENLLTPGQMVTLYGHRSADAGERRMAVVRTVIDGRNYVLYPRQNSLN